MATSKDVAKLAGVSHTTVSRAFRGDVKLRKETYERVMAAAAELHYTPNYLAASLKRQQSKTIGLVSSSMQNPFFMIVADRLERILEQHGYRLLLAFDDYDYDKQQRAVRAMIGSQAEAVIFTPQPGPEPDYIRNPDLHFIQLFSNLYPHLTSLDFDDNHGAYVAARRLLEAGHRRVLMAGGSNRVGGFLKACGEFPDAAAELLTEGGAEDEVCRRLMEKILLRRPTAILAVGDWFASCVYDVIKQHKLRIPDDISLIVFDDLEWTRMLDITVVAHPIGELAETLVNQLMDLLQGKAPPPAAVFEPFLIERSSVKDLPPSVRDGSRP